MIVSLEISQLESELTDKRLRTMEQAWMRQESNSKVKGRVVRLRRAKTA